ncbi:hypothetical protein ACWOFR_12555 [Carnobacterium gallinarum]|uniref:hypothetical protein n=1 Tax=Carnobacterium gallinarum TaxID=2749 RepID=UPI0005584FEF|nr:hypothetical protein [Carnobacterium gallinarum]
MNNFHSHDSETWFGLVHVKNDDNWGDFKNSFKIVPRVGELFQLAHSEYAFVVLGVITLPFETAEVDFELYVKKVNRDEWSRIMWSKSIFEK